MLGQLEADGRTIVCDLEAGIGTIVRAGAADVVLLVAEPTAKGIEVARRSVELNAGRARIVVVANRVRDHEDADAVRNALAGHEVVVVPEDPAVRRADREGLAPIDAGGGPGLQAMLDLARLVGG